MTGPAGPQFEVSVGVHYALAVLAETECFGLPGAVASKIAFQRRDQGHPLDDIILTGVSWEGATQTLEIQAKRSLSFTKSNTVFGDIVADMVAAQSIDPERRFAVAIERTSGAIENGVHEALELAKHVSDEGSLGIRPSAAFQRAPFRLRPCRVDCGTSRPLARRDVDKGSN